jgi:hypothetical protein
VEGEVSGGWVRHEAAIAAICCSNLLTVKGCCCCQALFLYRLPWWCATTTVPHRKPLTLNACPKHEAGTAPLDKSG